MQDDVAAVRGQVTTQSPPVSLIPKVRSRSLLGPYWGLRGARTRASDAGPYARVPGFGGATAGDGHEAELTLRRPEGGAGRQAGGGVRH